MDKEVKIVVVVYEGLVQNVYANDSSIDVRVLDYDTDDSDECVRLYHEANKLDEDIAQGNLIQVY